MDGKTKAQLLAENAALQVRVAGLEARLAELHRSEAVLSRAGTLTDITERRQREEELRRQNAELAAYDYSVSHDLKAPLGYISLLVEWLLDELRVLNEEELRQSLQSIAAYAHRGNTIVESLLLLSQPEAIELKPLAMADIIASARAGLEILIEKAQAEVVLPRAWPVALGHPALVERVWDNLMSNAIQYGGHQPRLELGSDISSGGQVRFWVRDNGPGIGPGLRAQLFTPFTRLEGDKVKGHGLGLYIARRIVEKLGGHIGVESNGLPGLGSLFYFTLPAASKNQQLSSG
jgi:signal transduction histidine kinase